MALDRKDFRGKLDPDIHAALKAICEVDDIDMGVFIEQLIVPVVQKRIHDATVLAGQLHRSGITGIARESRPSGRKTRA